MIVLLHTVSPVLAHGFEALRLPGIRAIAFTGESAMAADAAREHRADVILLDPPAQIDFASISEVAMRCPETPIVLWVYSISVEMAHQARARGVRGVLRKDLPEELMTRCLRAVANGELWFDRALMNSMLQVREVKLSPRERQLMWLIAQGLSNKQLAAELSISEGTVKVYLAKLFRKVGVHDRYELAMHGLRSLGMSTAVGAAAGAGQFAGPLVVPGGLRRQA
jgi:DNA-binding NarL/FixJ family response regulator